MSDKDRNEQPVDKREAHVQSETGVQLKLTPLKAGFAVICVMLMVTIYIAAIAFLRLQSPFPGLIFSLLWGGIYRAAFKELGQVFGGSMCGIGLAYIYQIAPAIIPHYGTAVAMIVILAAVYCLLLGWLPRIINNSAMMFLTIGCIPIIQAQESFPQDALAVVLSAVYFGVPIFILTQRQRARAII